MNVLHAWLQGSEQGCPRLSFFSGVAIGETFGGVESPELVDCNYFSPVLSILPPSVTGNQIRGKKRLIRTKVGAMTLERQLH
jgi:hypothetical protein